MENHLCVLLREAKYDPKKMEQLIFFPPDTAARAFPNVQVYLVFPYFHL